MKPLALLVSLLLAVLLQPHPAWAASEPYRVVFDGPFASLTEEGADFFAHMDGFRPGQTQTGEFICENRTNGPVAISVKLVPRDNALAGALSTEIRAGSLEGETVGLLSMRQQEEVFLCRLESGQSAPFAFLATVSNEVDARARAMTGLAEWEFIAVAEPSEGAEAERPDLDPDPNQDTKVDSSSRQTSVLPQTGDTAAIALVGLATAGALVIALIAQRNKRF